MKRLREHIGVQNPPIKNASVKLHWASYECGSSGGAATNLPGKVSCKRCLAYLMKFKSLPGLGDTAAKPVGSAST